jgi:hypothetical protein
MKHRDQMRTALSHERPDRCPMQISFTPEFASRLEAVVNVAGGDHHNPHGGGNTYELERALDEDMLLTSVGWANSYYANETYNPGGDSYTDEWRVGWRNCRYTTHFGDGYYTEISRHHWPMPRPSPHTRPRIRTGRSCTTKPTG